MNLTQEQMENILTENKRLIVNFAKRYANKFGPNNSDMLDDFIQDVTVAFIERINKTNSMDEAKKFYREALHEMSLDVLSYQPLSVPRRTGGMKTITNSMPKFCSAEETDDIECVMAIDTIAAAIEKTAFDKFYGDLNEKDQKIIELYSNGMSIKDISITVGVSYDNVRYRLRRCNKEYVASCGDEGYLGGNQQ